MWLFSAGVDLEAAFLERVGRERALWGSLSSLRMEGDVSRARLCICCPVQQGDTVGEMSSEVLMSHVLIPHEFGEEMFTSCNGEVVSVVGRDMVLRTDTAEERRVRIVSMKDEEIPLESIVSDSISLSADMKEATVKVYNISRPFYGELRAPDNPDEVEYDLVEKYSTVLRSHGEAQTIFDGLDGYIDEVKTVSSSSANGLSRVSPSLSASICAVWEENTAHLLNCDPSITEMITRGGSSYTEYERILVGQVAESYLMHGVSECVFEWISLNSSVERSKLVKIMSTIFRHTQSDLNIIPEFQVDQSRAVRELMKITAGNRCSARSPVDKLLILQRCVGMIREAIDRNVRENFPDNSDLEMSTDELIMTIVWVVLQAFLEEGLDDLLSHIRYISQFHFVSSPTSQLEFVLCHFQVALSWLYKLGGFSTEELMFSEGVDLEVSGVGHGESGGEEKDSLLGRFESSITVAERRISSYIAHKEEARAEEARAEEARAEEARAEEARAEAGVDAKEASLRQLEFSLAVLGCGRQGHPSTLEKLRSYHGGRRLGLKSVASAPEFGVVATGDGSVHCYGLPDSGRLGMELTAEFDRVLPIRSPRVVEAMEPMGASGNSAEGWSAKAVSCGAKHALCLTESGSLYTWGDNRTLQLGVSLTPGTTEPRAGTGAGGTTNHWSSPALTRSGGPLARAKELAMYGCCSPVRVHALHRVRVVAIACGSYHSLCLSSEGQVHSWGRSANGRLGHGLEVGGDGSVAASPALVQCPRWLSSSSGRADDGNDTTQHGQGRGSPRERERSRVVHVSAGHAHSVAVTEDGDVYSWGAGMYGRLGQGSHMDQLLPRPIPVFEKCRVYIVAASAGRAHSVFLSREGLLFGCGLRAQGQLGPVADTFGSEGGEKDTKGSAGSGDRGDAELWPLPLLRSEDWKGRVEKVRCGAFHTVAMDSRGTITQWGQDDNGTAL